MYTAEKVLIGGKGGVRRLELGGDAPIAIQTMWKQPLREDTLQDTVRKITELEQLGCDILRFAVPDAQSAEVFVKLTGMTPMPLVADIHFDYRLALRCMDGCAAKIRINPGNIGTEDRVKAVIKKAQDTGTALRIGVNSGSLPADIRNRMEQEIRGGRNAEEARAAALVAGAQREAALFDKYGFKQEWDAEKRFAEAAYEANLSDAQAKSLYAFFHKIGEDQQAQLAEAVKKQAEETDAALKKEFGNKVSEKMEQYTKGLKAFGSDSIFSQLEQTGLAYHPDFVKMFIKIGEALGESRTVLGDGKAPTGGITSARDGGTFSFFGT